jgi:hypothetical protein
LKRLTHMAPDPAPLKPTRYPAWVALKSGSAIRAAMIFALCTKRADSVRELARRRISLASSVVKVRNLIIFGISSPKKLPIERELYSIY